MLSQILTIVAFVLLGLNLIGFIAVTLSYLGVHLLPKAGRRLRSVSLLMFACGAAVSVAMLLDARTTVPAAATAPSTWLAHRTTTFDATPMTEHSTVPGTYTLAYTIDFTGVDRRIGAPGSGRTAFEATGGTAEVRLTGNSTTTNPTTVPPMTLRYDAATDGWTVLDAATSPSTAIRSGTGLGRGITALYAAAGLDQRPWIDAERYEAEALVHTHTGEEVTPNGYKATGTGDAAWSENRLALWRGSSSQRHSRQPNANLPIRLSSIIAILLLCVGGLFCALAAALSFVPRSKPPA